MNCAPNSAGVLIVGYGNRMRSDDGVGPRAAQRLAGLGYDALEEHQLTPELAERVSSARLVIFIDADVAAPPGEIAVTRLAAAPGFPPVTRHFCSPPELLSLARELYGGAPPAAMIGIGGECFDWGEAISECAARGLELAVTEARRLAGGR
jgi:hydrogenase maturation protease